MARTIVYMLLGIPIGLLFGIVLFGTDFGIISSAVACSLIGLSTALFMNTNHILDRPFWNRQDVEFMASPSRLTMTIPSPLREKVFEWMRSKVQD